MNPDLEDLGDIGSFGALIYMILTGVWYLYRHQDELKEAAQALRTVLIAVFWGGIVLVVYFSVSWMAIEWFGPLYGTMAMPLMTWALVLASALYGFLKRDLTISRTIRATFVLSFITLSIIIFLLAFTAALFDNFNVLGREFDFRMAFFLSLLLTGLSILLADWALRE